MKTILVVDSHTGGEPTRIVVDGGPDLGSGSVAEQATVFENQFDRFRTAIIGEPRGSDVIVGGMLCQPADKTCSAGIIFFDNAGLIGMCGHGTIGLMVTLKHLGRIQTGSHQIETTVGIVGAKLVDPNYVSVENVASYRIAQGIAIDVAGFGSVVGDVAWGGNWFFLVNQQDEKLELANVQRLLEFTKCIRRQLAESGITGENNQPIKHVELVGPAIHQNANARNFVLCPGGAYDRSPCGTGTSAKIACLAADGQLNPGETWRQEGIVGSVFEATYQFDDQQRVIPEIKGTAFITGESKLILDPNDPFCYGIDA